MIRPLLTRARRALRPAKGFTLIELVGAIMLFVTAVAFISTAVVVALGTQRDARSRAAVEQKLDALLGQAATIAPDQLVAGTFNVPALCADVSLNVGSAGASCITADNTDYRVAWTRVAGGGGTAVASSDWVTLTAATTFEGKSLRRASTVATPTNGAPAGMGKVRVQLEGERAGVAGVLVVSGANTTQVVAASQIDGFGRAEMSVQASACTLAVPCRLALAPAASGWGTMPDATAGALAFAARTATGADGQVVVVEGGVVDIATAVEQTYSALSGVAEMVASSQTDGMGCALLTSGALRCWGANAKGQLGTGSTTDIVNPRLAQVSGLTAGVTAFSQSGEGACAIAGGALLCFGDGSQGQIGNDTTTAVNSTPTQVTGATSGVSKVSKAQNNACYLTTAGALYCWGQNVNNRMLAGAAGASPQKTPVAATDAALTTGTKQVSVGSATACAITAADALRCWGNAAVNSANLGDGTTNASAAPVAVSGAFVWSKVSVGATSTCGIVQGGVKCFGDNTYGQLGDSTNTDRTTPTDVTGLASGVVDITVGDNGSHYCALLATGAAKCWGLNDKGQLGDATTTDRTAPVDVTVVSGAVAKISAGNRSTCAVLGDATSRCWGLNNSGQLGNNTTTGANANTAAQTPYQEPQLPGAISLSAGGSLSQGATTTLTATVTANGSGVAGWPVVFGARQDGAVVRGIGFSPAACVTNASGVCSVTMSAAAGTPAGSFAVSATVGSRTAVYTATANWTVSQTLGRIASRPIEIDAGTSSTMQFTALDGAGALMSGVSITASGPGLTFSSATTNASGVATLNVAAGTNAAGTVTVTAAAVGVANQTQVTINPNITTIVGPGGPVSVPAGTTVEFTVTATGAGATPAANKTLTVTSSSASLLPTPSVTTNANGIATIRVRPAQGVGTGTYTVTIQSGSVSRAVTVVVGP